MKKNMRGLIGPREKPVLPTQLDRIERVMQKINERKSREETLVQSILFLRKNIDDIQRMLKWLVIMTQMERRSTLAGLGCNPEAIGKELGGLCGKAPDISDILK